MTRVAMQTTVNRSRDARDWGATWICLWLFVPALLAGCRSESAAPSRGYGRISGAGYADSLNGTRVLRNMFVAAGHKVQRADKLTPRTDRFDHIVWFVADRRAPSAETVDRLEEWLYQQNDRTLIVVGRDFDADVLYWQHQLARTADPAAREFYRYRLALAMSQQDEDRFAPDVDVLMGAPTATTGPGNAAPAPPRANSPDRRYWYQLETVPEFRGRRFRGPLSRMANMGRTEVYIRQWLVPNTSRYDYQPLLVVDDVPMVYSLNIPEWGDGEIIVVANGSFLLNYPLTNPEHRLLAQTLVDALPTTGDVLFLESGHDVPIRESDYEIHNQWAWIGQPPLRYIVPHLLLWGVLFSFAIYPIFGRPRRLPKKSTARFRDHVEALGKLLRKTDSPESVRQWIARYHQRTRHDRSTESRSAATVSDSESVSRGSVDDESLAVAADQESQH